MWFFECNSGMALTCIGAIYAVKHRKMVLVDTQSNIVFSRPELLYSRNLSIGMWGYMKNDFIRNKTMLWTEEHNFFKPWYKYKYELIWFYKLKI